MTLDELNKLDDAALDAMLGRLLGYELLLPSHNGRIMYRVRLNRESVDTDWLLLPRYTTDRNAIAEVQRSFHGNAHPKALTEQETKFRDKLCQVMEHGWYESARLLKAEPRQLTIAAILTLK